MLMKKSIRHQIVTELPYSVTKFLIENKCYSQYINNVVNTIVIINNRRGSIDTHHFYAERARTGDRAYFNYAFPWNSTIEGFNFWKEIYYKFSKQICR